ncbi:MAG: hypothetical protein R2711_06690 [Acidimicrobiales bacterium]
MTVEPYARRRAGGRPHHRAGARNIGIVLPEPGFSTASRGCRTEHPAALSTRPTPCRRPRRLPRAWGLRPDIVTARQSRSPAASRSGPYGLSPNVARRLHDEVVGGDADIVDVGGVGGTSPATPLSLAAARATLRRGAHRQAFVGMIELATRFTAGVRDTLRHDLPWTVTQLGARSVPSPARAWTGTESAAAHDDDLEEYLHLAMANRGILLTVPDMALMAPSTRRPSVDRHTDTSPRWSPRSADQPAVRRSSTGPRAPS